ncbi:hypothetical protein EUX98_g4248 [Antrodiella citrinella]|uniref:G-alpha-domain-containing protein n=1 Tax=Antrodiella citrinella TaxID=2447956 RepID=A0A4S4MUG4_9APHY|nr:hypothetical protein EUX98_g4248 [Antrodiella citrinella]
MNDSCDWPPPPPKDETSAEKALRLEREESAKKKSEEIDAAIEQDRVEREKRGSQRKVLLLGQSQSGKSTLLKSFQLLYAPLAFRAEAEAWRAVIYLNLVHSINILLEVVEIANIRTSRAIRQLQIRLSPLKHVLATLTQSLSSDSVRARQSADNPDIDVWRARRASGISLHSSAWRSLAKVSEPGNVSQYEVDNARNIIVACHDDILALWANEDVHKCLQDQRVALDGQASYFLAEAHRIACSDYFPTDDDILRARLETFGIEEHCIVSETVDYGQEWVWYDVEGSRSSRVWVPYFDDVQTVMFVCSLANFDLDVGDDGMNNFTECLRLWKGICENRLLAESVFFLFLNKSDLLDDKLKSGVFFGSYVEGFGHRSNDCHTVSQFYKDNFFVVHRDFSPKPRLLQMHVICAIDTLAMADIFDQTRHAILASSMERMYTL